jgi:hypothetical protein
LKAPQRLVSAPGAWFFADAAKTGRLPQAPPTHLYAIEFMSDFKPTRHGFAILAAFRRCRRNPAQRNQQNPVAFK